MQARSTAEGFSLSSIAVAPLTNLQSCFNDRSFKPGQLTGPIATP